MKTFTFAGSSVFNGEKKSFFANNKARVHSLAYAGHTEIVIVKLAGPMTKQQAQDVLDGKEVVVSVGDVVKIAAANKRALAKFSKVPAEFQPGTDAEAFVASWFAKQECLISLRRSLAQ